MVCRPGVEGGMLRKTPRVPHEHSYKETLVGGGQTAQRLLQLGFTSGDTHIDTGSRNHPGVLTVTMGFKHGPAIAWESQAGFPGTSH